MGTQLTAKDLAEMLQISARGLDLLIERRAAPPFYWLGRARRWDPAVVQTWIEEKTKEATEHPKT